MRRKGAGRGAEQEGEAEAAQSLLTRSVQEGPCWTGHAAEAAPVAVLLQPLLPSGTGLGAHGDGSLRGAQRRSGRWRQGLLGSVNGAGKRTDSSPGWAATGQLAVVLLPEIVGKLGCLKVKVGVGSLLAHTLLIFWKDERHY